MAEGEERWTEAAARAIYYEIQGLAPDWTDEVIPSNETVEEALTLARIALRASRFEEVQQELREELNHNHCCCDFDEDSNVVEECGHHMMLRERAERAEAERDEEQAAHSKAYHDYLMALADLERAQEALRDMATTAHNGLMEDAEREALIALRHRHVRYMASLAEARERGET